MHIRSFLIIIILTSFLFFISCQTSTIWTGQTYTGSITDDDLLNDDDQYYDEYGIYFSGIWNLTVKSADDIDLIIEVYSELYEDTDNDGDQDSIYLKRIINTQTNDSKNFSIDLSSANNIIRIKVQKTDLLWLANDKTADYSIYAYLN